MAARSIASLSLSFGLVSIPVKLYSATESSAAVRFNMLDKDGSRLKQQYVSEKDQRVVERAEMVKGYEFEKDRFVIFQPEELKALQESPSHTIDIVAFIPEKAVDPIFYDKAYFLAPGQARREAVQPADGSDAAERPLRPRQVGLEGEAVRGAGASGRRRPRPAAAALRRRGALDEGARHREGAGLAGGAQARAAAHRADLRGHLRPDACSRTRRRSASSSAIDEKIAGKQIVANEPHETASSGGGQVIDLVEALRASLGRGAAGKDKAAAAAVKPAPAARPVAVEPAAAEPAKERKGVKRAQKAEVEVPAAAPARARAKK